MKQYFEVGEEVILQSKEKPELNGEYTIVDITDGKDRIDPTGVMVKGSRSYTLGYLLEGLTESDDDGSIMHLVWAQSALKKKHQRGESHNTFMDKIKSGDKIEESA